MNNFYVLCGIPGSGKTTFSQELANDTNSKLYHFDDIPESRDPVKSKDAKEKMYQEILKDLSTGHDVILDNLHTKLKWREDLLNIVKDINCKKILIVMTTSLEECLSRNRQRKARLPDFVIRTLSQNYEVPTIDEGWDEIIWR